VTALAPKWVITERKHNLNAEVQGRFDKSRLFSGNSHKKFIGIFVTFGVNTIITNHFKVRFGDVNNELFDELHSGYGFSNKLVVLMPFVVESNVFAVVIINARSGDNGATEVSANVFDNVFCTQERRFSVNIKAVGTMVVNI